MSVNSKVQLIIKIRYCIRRVFQESGEVLLKTQTFSVPQDLNAVVTLSRSGYVRTFYNNL